MSKIKILFILGIWTAILPYLGFPYSLKDIIYSITGIVIMYFAYSSFGDFKGKIETKEEKPDNFSENSNFNEEENSEAGENMEQKENTAQTF